MKNAHPMLQTRKNELLIGFIISILLSLFVNFTKLMRTYEVFSPQMVPPKLPFEDCIFYFSFGWFFIFTFLLFITNTQLCKIGDRLFKKKEYKIILFNIGISTVIAIGVFRLYPIVFGKFINEILEVDDFSISNIPTKESQTTLNSTIKPDFWISSKIDFKPFPHPLVTEHLFIVSTVLLSVLLIRLLNGKQQMQLEYEKLQTEKLQTSYNALMGQINPHFFFNSLNGLNSLIQNGEKEQTLTYLDELSNVFRYILQSNKKEMVTLAEEMQFVKAYTYLLGVRYEGKLFFSIHADPPLLLWYLPILSILPLIENAVKHNVISKQYPLQIDIYTTNESQIVVSNRIQPKIEECNSNGIGLKNLWGRYHMLTGKDIKISNRKDYFKVTLPLLDSPIHS